MVILLTPEVNTLVCIRNIKRGTNFTSGSIRMFIGRCLWWPPYLFSQTRWFAWWASEFLVQELQEFHKRWISGGIWLFLEQANGKASYMGYSSWVKQQVLCLCTQFFLPFENYHTKELWGGVTASKQAIQWTLQRKAQNQNQFWGSQILPADELTHLKLFKKRH